MVDAYLTVQGELLFIIDCGDAQRVTVPKAWVSGAKVQVRHKKNRILTRNVARVDERADWHAAHPRN
jgi:hypothetical protein